MDALYVSSNSFKVSGDETSEFITNRRVKIDCGVDGVVIASVVSSSYDTTDTTVVIDENMLTSNLVSVLYSVVKPGQDGNISTHTHTSSEGDGGELYIPTTILGLIDTPITYSGTEGYYLQSTGSGTIWATISGTGGGTSDVESFLDLEDTPTTYSGTEGYYLQSTGSGIEFLAPPANLYSSENAPTGLEEDRNIGDFNIVTSEKSIYIKNRDYNSRGFIAKSIIIDVADNWGHGSGMGLREVDFYYVDVKLGLTSSDYTAYATTYYGIDSLPEYAFDTSLSLTGSYAYTGWWTYDSNTTNQRLICVFNTEQVFDTIKINNWHTSGINTTYGVKNVKLYISTDTITDTTYNATITNSTLLFDGQFDQHVGSDVEDTQTLDTVEPQIDAGWDELLTIPKTLLDLNDTPTTYSGGQYLISTSSGISYLTPPPIVYSSENAPTGLEEDRNIGDFNIVTSESSIYEKTGAYSIEAFTAKSVILDIADNWGDSAYLGLREVDFYFKGSKLTLTASDYTAQAPSYASTNYLPENIFDTSKNLTGDPNDDNNSWLGTSGNAANQRVSVVFNSEIVFDSIVVNNFHYTGSSTNRGAKNVKIYTSPDSITSTTYGAAISNGVLIFDNQFDEHISSDVADSQELVLIYDSSNVVTGWDEILSVPQTLIDLEDTPITYSGTEGYYLQSTGSGIEFIIPEFDTWLFGFEAPDDNITAVSGTIYFDTSSGYIYEKNGEVVIDDVDLEDTFDGVVLDTNLWETRIYDNASVTVDNSLQLNNLTGGGHSGSHVYTMNSFDTVGLTVLSFKWKPHTNHYPSAATPRVTFRHESSFTLNTAYGGITTNCIHLQFGQGSDTTERTVLRLQEVTSDVATQSISINHSEWHTVVISLNWDTREIVVDLDDTSYTIEYTLSESVINSIGSTFVVEFGTCDYDKNNTELFDDIVLRNNADVNSAEIVTWDFKTSLVKDFVDLNDTPSTYSGTEGLYLQSTGSGTIWAAVSGTEVDLLSFGSGPPESDTTGVYYYADDLGYIYEKIPETNTNFFDNFTGSELDIDLWNTHITPAASVTVDDALELNNLTGGAHSGSAVSTVLSPETLGTTIITCKWLPHKDHYSTADGPYIALRNPDNYTPNSTYGTPTTNTILVRLFSNTNNDTTDRTQIKLFAGAASISEIDAVSISIDENQWHDIEISINWETGAFIFDLDDSAYIINSTISQDVLNAIGDNFKIQFGTCDYEKNNTEKFDDISINFDVTVPQHWAYIADFGKFFLNLNDTPSTYSGTEGYYLQSTGSGTVWATISGGGGGTSDVESLLDLEDTPSTYSGTNGYYLKSTGSGTVWSELDVPYITSSSGIPIDSYGEAGDFYILEQEGIIYKKQSVYQGDAVKAKTLIFDFVDNYGSTSYMALRSIEFRYNNSLITLTSSDFTAYSTTFFSSMYYPQFAFDTSLSKTDSWNNNGWISGSGFYTNQRLIIVVNDVINFDTIVINNCHHDGGFTDAGVKNTKIYASTDSITDTTYNGSVPNSTLLFDNVIDQHTIANEIDDQYFTMSSGISPIFSDGWEVVLSTTVSSNEILTEERMPTGDDGNIGDLFIDSVGNGVYEKTQEADDGARLFWRLYTSDNNDATYCEIATFELRATVGGEDLAYNSGGTATESQVWSAGYEGSKAFDNTISTYWITSSPEPSWLQYEFTSAVIVRQIFLVPRGGYGAYMPKTFTLQASNNGTSWEDVQTWTNITSWTDAGMEFEVIAISGTTGWEELFTVSDNFIDFDDTPTTYSGTEGHLLQSTGSGIAFVTQPPIVYSSENAPTGLEDGPIIGDFNISTSDSTISLKNSVRVEGLAQAKSVILDIADNWGDASFSLLRSVEFMYKGELITNIPVTNFEAYATTYYDTNYYPKYVFDTSLNKVGGRSGNSWLTLSGYEENQRLICVFNTETLFDEIVVNNGHSSGLETYRGVKNVKITISSDEITDTTYNAPISNSDIIFDGQFDEHVVEDVEDPQELGINGPLIDTGWDVLLNVPQTFINLNDTPTTYSGSDNLILKSTGSGIGFYTPPPVLYTSENIPTGLEEAAIGDFDIVTSEQSIYIKNRILTEDNISAKSVILDIADGWGSTILGVRSVDFMYSGEIIPNIATTNFVAYATTDLGTGYEPELSFDTSTSKLSGYSTNQWLSDSGASTNQRLICVFNSEIMFDSIVINNTHSNGAGTDQGSKNVKITVSTDTITDTTYNTSVSNSYVIFDGQFDEHVTSNVEDPQELSIQSEISDTGWDEVLAVSKNFTDLADTPTTYSGTSGYLVKSTGSGLSFYTPSPVVYTSEDAPTGFEDATVGDFNIVNSDDTIYVRNRIATIEDVTAKSVILDIADNWGDPSFISIRSVDFFYGGELITNITSTDFVAYATTFHSSTYVPQYSFDTSKSKIGTLSGNQWLSLSSNITNQRLICVFNEATTFDEIVINNAHSYGDQVSRGSKNIKISFSTDEITDTTYNATISNSLVLFDGQLNQHITSDVEDPQTLDVYGEVTDSGWDELLKVSKSLLDLSDTPSTYSGAGGYYLISTSSGVIWELPTGRVVDNVTPDYFTEGNVGDFIINGTDRSIHEKNREGSIEGTTARSVIFDIADVWGGASTGIRSIWFYNDDELVVASDTNADAYATNSNGSGYAAILAFDTSLPKIGAAYDNSWQSLYSSDQRLIIVFNNTITFDQIIVNNYHDSGTWTNKGAKNVKIYVTPSVYTDTTFEAVVTSGTLLFDDQFTQHPATNIVADELITLPDFTIDTGWDEIISFPNNLIGLIDGETDPTIKTYDIDTYYISKESSTIFKLNDSPTASGIIGNVKSVIFDIADNYGNGYNIGIRAVEFAKDGVVWPLTTTDSVAYATTYYDIEWAYPINVFDTTLLKTGDYNDVDSAGWLSNTYQTTNQRLIVVFNNSLDFDEIIINNAHSSGSNTNWGAENVVVTVSTSEITDTTYAAAIENASVVFDGQFAEHVASDVVDDQSITLTVPTTEEFIFRTWDSVFEAPTSFIALEDTPTTYSGGGQYLRTTTSGIEAIDGIILKAPNNSEWLLQVTNSGTLYTVEV